MSQSYRVNIELTEDGFDRVNRKIDDFVDKAKNVIKIQENMKEALGDFGSSIDDNFKKAYESILKLDNALDNSFKKQVKAVEDINRLRKDTFRTEDFSKELVSQVATIQRAGDAIVKEEKDTTDKIIAQLNRAVEHKKTVSNIDFTKNLASTSAMEVLIEKEKVDSIIAQQERRVSEIARLQSTNNLEAIRKGNTFEINEYRSKTNQILNLQIRENKAVNRLKLRQNLTDYKRKLQQEVFAYRGKVNSIIDLQTRENRALRSLITRMLPVRNYDAEIEAYRKKVDAIINLQTRENRALRSLITRMLSVRNYDAEIEAYRKKVNAIIKLQTRENNELNALFSRKTGIRNYDAEIEAYRKKVNAIINLQTRENRALRSLTTRMLSVRNYDAEIETYRKKVDAIIKLQTRENNEINSLLSRTTGARKFDDDIKQYRAKVNSLINLQKMENRELASLKKNVTLRSVQERFAPEIRAYRDKVKTITSLQRMENDTLAKLRVTSTLTSEKKRLENQIKAYREKVNTVLALQRRENKVLDELNRKSIRSMAPVSFDAEIKAITRKEKRVISSKERETNSIIKSNQTLLKSIATINEMEIALTRTKYRILLSLHKEFLDKRRRLDRFYTRKRQNEEALNIHLEARRRVLMEFDRLENDRENTIVKRSRNKRRIELTEEKSLIDEIIKLRQDLNSHLIVLDRRFIVQNNLIRRRLARRNLNIERNTLSASEREHKRSLERRRRETERFYNSFSRAFIDFNRFGSLAATRFISLIDNPLARIASIGGVALLTLEEVGDRYQEIANRIRPVTLTSEELHNSLQGVFDIAKELRVGVNDVSNAFSKFSIVFRRINRSQEEAISFTRDLTLLFKASGANAVEVASNITQISQALNQGVLRGDEFRAVAERLPRVFDALAQVMMVSTGELQGLANRGLIPAEKAIQGFELAASRLGAQFPLQAGTLGEALVVLGDSFTNLVGALGDINVFRDSLNSISDLLSDLAKNIRESEIPASKIVPDEKELEVFSVNLKRIITELSSVRKGIDALDFDIFDTPTEIATGVVLRVNGVDQEKLLSRQQKLVLEYLAELRKINGIEQTRIEFLEEQLKFRKDLSQEQRDEFKEELEILKTQNEHNNLLSRRDALARENLQTLREQFIASSRSREEAEKERQIGVIANKLKKDNVQLTVQQENALKNVLDITNALQKIDATIARGGRTQLENEITRFATLNNAQKLFMTNIMIVKEDLRLEKEKEKSLAEQLVTLRKNSAVSTKENMEVLAYFRIRLKILEAVEKIEGETNSLTSQKKILNTEILRLEREIQKILNQKEALETKTIANKERITELEMLESSLNASLAKTDENRAQLIAIEGVQQERLLSAIRQRLKATQDETKNIGLQGIALIRNEEMQRIANLRSRTINKNILDIRSTIIGIGTRETKQQREQFIELRKKFNLTEEEFKVLQDSSALNSDQLKNYAMQNNVNNDIVKSITMKVGLSKQELNLEKQTSQEKIKQAQAQSELSASIDLNRATVDLEVERNKLSLVGLTGEEYRKQLISNLEFIKVQKEGVILTDNVRKSIELTVDKQIEALDIQKQIAEEQNILSRIERITNETLEGRLILNEKILQTADMQLMKNSISLQNHMLVTEEIQKQSNEIRKQIRDRELLRNNDPFTFDGISNLAESALGNYLEGAGDIMKINETLRDSFSNLITSGIDGLADSFVNALVAGESFTDGLRGTLSSALQQLAKDLLVVILRFTLLSAFGGTTGKRTEGTSAGRGVLPSDLNTNLPPVALNPIPINPSALSLSGASASPVVNNRIINVVSPTLVGDYLASPDGTNSILNTISNNSDVVRRSISA